MSANVAKPARMSVDQFLAWTASQPGTDRWELVDGEVVGMAGDRVRHNRAKFAVARALDDAVETAGLPCTVFTDGVGVRIDEWTLRIPDASIQCGAEADPDSMTVEPVVVVEVTSPSSMRADEDQKLVEYLSVPSIQHYLVVHPQSGVIVHHSRQEASDIRTRILRDGEIDLSPPGVKVPVALLLGGMDRRGVSV